VRTRWLGIVLIASISAVAHAETHKTKADAAVKTEIAKGPPAYVPVLGVLEPDQIMSLTYDPVLGHADRIDGDEATGVVAFTFDDGPNPDTTPAVIDALEKYNIPATFFIVTRRIVGKQGEKAREILARILAGGFEIGSHSVSHPNMKRATKPIFEQQIDGSIKTLAPTANRAIGMFRPPFGAFNGIGKARLKKLGLTDVRWSVDTLDWQAKNQDKLRKKVLKMILDQKGGVVLMHDVKPITARVVGEVLDDLEAENCRRLAAHEEPILPVSLHYFLKDGKTARPIPDGVRARTAAYRTALPARCAARPVIAPPPPPPAAPAK
jgi:peptidoglycan/xylan/chitin deacetylase (PgdA/CDA1 family)